MNNKSKTVSLAGTAVLAAIVVVLQLFASTIKVGPFTITLALVPIIIGSIVFGKGAGATLGTVFGAIVCYSVITGADVGGYIMFQQNPVITLLVCMAKSTLAGFLAGLFAQLINKTALKSKTTVSAAAAAVICPVVNTGILSVAMITIFYDLVSSWAVDAGFSSPISYIILGMVGINFLVELAINIVFVPAITHIIKAVRR